MRVLCALLGHFRAILYIRTKLLQLKKDYEKHGLLSPEIMENGYREYKDEQISALKEIFLLRKTGIGIADIKTILVSVDKLATLAACKSKTARQLSMLNVQRECISHLLDNGYNIDSSFQYVAHQLDENRVIKERLAEAFPGNYGLFLSLQEFQKASGYLNIFIENIKILSSEYLEYHTKLNESNDLFLRQYPDAADILGYY